MTTKLPDGSAFDVLSLPLPKDHWLYAKHANVPPMPFRCGTDSAQREALNEMVWAAAKYAIRSATMNGQEPDFDPDALCQNMVVGLLGYHSSDGLFHEKGFDPKTPPPLFSASWSNP